MRNSKKEISYISSVNGLKTVDKYKYLGVYIDNALTFKDIFEQIEKKFDHFATYVQRLSLHRISLKMRYNLF